MIVVDKFSEILEHFCQMRLEQTNSIIIPIGTLVAYMVLSRLKALLARSSEINGYCGGNLTEC